MVAVIAAEVIGLSVGFCSLWKIFRGYDSTLWFTIAMVTLSGCATFILVQ